MRVDRKPLLRCWFTRSGKSTRKRGRTVVDRVRRQFDARAPPPLDAWEVRTDRPEAAPEAIRPAAPLAADAGSLRRPRQATRAKWAASHSWP